jgi:hypothetical protein
LRAATALLSVSVLAIAHSSLGVAQMPGPNNSQPQSSIPDASSSGAIKLPDAPENTVSLGAGMQPPMAVGAVKPNSAPVMINGRPYVRPTAKEQFDDYVKNSYGLPALVFTSIRASIAQVRGKPDEWGQDWPGFGQRFGSAAATTAIDGNVRYGMEMLFKEDMRYIPCHGCSAHRKIENALLAEVTARHDSDGHRFFTITPTLSDMSGPMIANSVWIPGHTTINGFYGSRLIFAYRIGGHLFNEFVLERRHNDPKLPD